jgi:hypothetical protein
VKSAAEAPFELLVELPPLLHPAKTVSKEIAHRKAIRDCMRSAPTVSVTDLLLPSK